MRHHPKECIHLDKNDNMRGMQKRSLLLKVILRKSVLNFTLPCCWDGTLVFCTFNTGLPAGNVDAM